MDAWNAWGGAPALTFLHHRVRSFLLHRGVEEAFVHVNGSPVHVYAAGPRTASRTVVLLHGLGDSANNWFRTLPLLAWRGDRVLAIDLPGHGWSPPHDERGFLHIREHAAVVKRVTDEMGAGSDRALVGHSLGGWVAARCILGEKPGGDTTRRTDGRVGVATRAHLDGMPASRLVLIESAGLAYEGMWDSIEMLRMEHEADVRRFFETVMHKVPTGFGLVSREVASVFRSPAVLNFLNGYDRTDVIDDAELERITAKTTILWGENDGLIPPILAHRWNAGIPGSRLVWMPRCGHAPQFERPILFQSLIEEALGHPPFTQEVRARLTARIPEGVRRRLWKRGGDHRAI